MLNRKSLFVGSLFAGLLLASGSASALSFTDNFTDEVYTSNNWSVYSSVSGTWQATNNGYIGSGGDINFDYNQPERDAAVSFADNEQQFLNEGLVIRSLITINRDIEVNRHTGGVFFSGVLDSLDGPFFASADFVYNENSESGNQFGINLESGQNKVSHTFQTPEIGIDTEEEFFDRLFGLEIRVYTDSFYATVYDGDFGLNNIIGVWGMDSSLPEYGLVGLTTNSNATFDYFSVSDNVAPVPEPATFLLLGTGLISLVGLRRKSQK